VDSRAKLTGEAIYTGDLTLPDMLHGKVLREPACSCEYSRHRCCRARRFTQSQVAIASLVAATAATGSPAYATLAVAPAPVVAMYMHSGASCRRSGRRSQHSHDRLGNRTRRGNIDGANTRMSMRAAQDLAIAACRGA